MAEDNLTLEEQELLDTDLEEDDDPSEPVFDRPIEELDVPTDLPSGIDDDTGELVPLLSEEESEKLPEPDPDDVPPGVEP